MAPLTPLGLIRILGHVSAIMAIPMVGGAVAGILLDRAQGTSPLFVLSGFAIGNLVAFTGRTIPLCCENIFAPLVPRPTTAEGVDALARRAREFLEDVTRGLQLPRQ